MDNVHNLAELLFHLVGTAEKVRVVLRERADTCKSVKLTTLLVAINGSELCNSQRKVFVRARLILVNHTVVRAVHWLEHINLAFLGCGDWLEAVFPVVVPVARSYVELLSANMRRHNLLITISFLNLFQIILKAKTDGCAFRQPDWQTFAHHIAEHKQLHFLADLAVVAFLGLLEKNKILVQKFLLREGDGVDAGELLALLVAAPVSASHAQHLDGLDERCVEQVWAAAKVGEVALFVEADFAVLQIVD